MPLLMWLHNLGHSHLGRGSTIPSASASQCNSLNSNSGSIGLSNLHLESNGSEPNTPTTQHSDAHGPQPGDRDNFRRLVIEPLGYTLHPDVGMAKIILKCIGTHYNGVYPNWSLIPLNTQGQMFNEFKKYYVWAPEHEEDVQVNFKLKASKLLSSTFCDCRRKNRIPKFMLPDRWALLLEHWSTDEKFKKRSEIGKIARASEKGGSLHTGGTISQVTRKERMEKELGRPVPVEEMFKVTHVKKSMNPTEEERLIEPRAQETYSAGELIRGSVYGYPENAYQKKKSWYCGSSFSSFDGGDRETISAMESKIAYLNVELAAVAERENKREEREKKREEERGGDCGNKVGREQEVCITYIQRITVYHLSLPFEPSIFFLVLSLWRWSARSPFSFNESHFLLEFTNLSLDRHKCCALSL
ncbi:hypothetical protein KY290_008920 [Solanum tuberosum]|uniref:Uncharacterized protein n=1 Tax=Solanum tuberosum TaxID=4113 RepID=A0ABQ7WBU6_SOLTU|nr:hypothetical protein KY289_009842 [Solanum tuberosum]KAH0715954.1 hypothetical protein KY284_008859 [Solanum tuberosum]KAH0747208.1 hypothetical protein KY285_008865 [Solanum tuberosum]KAH0777509.1 hypothetical protein KY290_008920 [Solanum tuberosum]